MRQFRESNAVSFLQRNLSAVVLRVVLSHCPFGTKLLRTAVLRLDAAGKSTTMSETNVTQLEEIEAMFVQCAHGMTTRDGTVTFLGPAHSTLFFADRPQRVVGHMHTRKFVNEWGEGENSFAEDPPNAVVSFLEEGDTVPEEVTMVIRNPQLTEETLTYKVEVLDGTLPARAGPCSLFIDPFGRPLSPGSAAGVRRRQRRR